MKNKNMQRLREAAEKINEALQFDLEMGSHHLTNVASEDFARVHPTLSGAIANLNEVLLSLDNSDEEGGTACRCGCGSGIFNDKGDCQKCGR